MSNILNRKAEGPSIVIALRIDRAAEAIDVSRDYLLRAISAGKLKVTEKRAAGKGRGVKLVLIDELRRYAATDELGEEDQANGQ